MSIVLLAAALIAAAVLARRGVAGLLAAAMMIAAPGCSSAGDAAAAGTLLTLVATALGLAMLGAITTGVPSSLLRPGSYHTFVFSTGSRGLTRLPQRVLLVGTMLATGTATAVEPTQIFDALDADTKFGQGSPLALMARAALAQAAFQKTSPEIWCVGIAEPSGGGTAKNVHTFTLTGPATADGTLTVRIAGRTISCGVQNGQANTVVATALQQACAAQHANLPVIATVAGAVVTLTATVKGVNGGDVAFQTIKLPAGIGLAHATGTAGAGTIDITAALDASLGRDYQGIAVENNETGDVDDATDHTAVAWGYATKRYRWVFFGVNSSLADGTTLAASANDFTIIVITCEDCPNLAGEMAACAAVRVFGTERANANYDGMMLKLYPPDTASSVFSGAEIESCLQGGATPLMPDSTGQRVKIERLVTTKITTSSAPDYSTFDLCTSRVAALMAQQIDIRYAQEFTGEDALLDLDENSPEYVVDAVRDMVIDIHRRFEAIRYIRNVEDHKDEILVEPNPDTAGRLDGVNPITVVSPLHQTAWVHQVQI